MKKVRFILIFSALYIVFFSGCAAHKDLAFDACYSIDANLQPEEHSMTYTETACITNTGTDSTRTLYFHIYGNMYKDLYKVEDGDIVIMSVKDEASMDLTFRRIQKGVLYRVTLNKPLEPSRTVELTFQCEVLIPDLERKYGISMDGDVQLPSFDIQLAVYDENGWDKAPLQEKGDGRYGAATDHKLTIRVPEAYTLACNGTELSCETSNGYTTYSFFAERRRDLIVIACKDYTSLTRTVGNTTILGYFNETANGVTTTGMETVMDYVAFALEYYSKVFMEYPYDTLVVTNAALGSNFSVSMEYSGLITVYFDNGTASSGIRTTAYHEVAHQWFYALVGNDENREPWLDEGFATFATGLCLEECGAVDVNATYWDIYRITDSSHAGEPVNVKADKASVYEFIIYNRGCMFLKHLMDAVGQEEFLALLSAYCQTHCYGIATTEDFLSTLYQGVQIDISDIVSEYIA